jgi:hypothetical protein
MNDAARADVDKSFSDALHLAAEAGDERRVRLLLKQGAPCTVYNNVCVHCERSTNGFKFRFAKGDTPLLAACRAEQVACARLILDHAEGRETIDWQSNVGPADTALILSVRRNNVELVRRCLEAGADPNLWSCEGNTTAMMLACGLGHEECVRLCLRYGGHTTTRLLDRDDVDSTAQWSPLTTAILHGHAQCVRACFDAGADLELHCYSETDEDLYYSEDDNTYGQEIMTERSFPLVLAVQQWQLETVKELCFCGAKRYPRDLALEEAKRQVAQGPPEHDEGWPAPAICLWLQQTRGFASPLCYLEDLSEERVRGMLRRGAAIRVRNDSDSESVSAVQCAQRLPPYFRPARLVLRAAEPWSSRTHHLWCDATHALVWPILCIGYALANERCRASVHAFVDAWRDVVMPQLFERD